VSSWTGQTPTKGELSEVPSPANSGTSALRRAGVTGPEDSWLPASDKD